jgi:hypothetical protein
MTPALAHDACPPMVVEATPSVTARWPGLPERVRDAFVDREDIDRCAHITLTSRDGAIDIEVSLPDGRSTHRFAPRRDDVIPAVEALLLVPQTPPEPESSTAVAPAPASDPTSAPAQAPLPAAPTPREVAVVTTASSVASRDAPSSEPTQTSGHMRIELSVATGARVGDGQAGVGVGALSFLDLSGWLVGFAGSLDGYRALSGAPESSGALELALLGGRRFRFGTMALDLAGGLAAALQGTTTMKSSTAPRDSGAGTGAPPQTVYATSSSTVPRLLLEVRLVSGALSTFRTFVGIDGDFGPARSPDASLLPEAPRLPLWTVGLALGATVGTL